MKVIAGVKSTGKSMNISGTGVCELQRGLPACLAKEQSPQDRHKVGELRDWQASLLPKAALPSSFPSLCCLLGV